MSFVIVTPEIMSTAASDSAGIASALGEANAAAATRTTALLAAGADEVSTAIGRAARVAVAGGLAWRFGLAASNEARPLGATRQKASMSLGQPAPPPICKEWPGTRKI